MFSPSPLMLLRKQPQRAWEICLTSHSKSCSICLVSTNPTSFNLQNSTFTAFTFTSNKNISSMTSLEATVKESGLCFLLEGSFTKTPSQHLKENLKKMDFTLKLLSFWAILWPNVFASILITSPGFGLSCETLFHSHKEMCDISYPSNGFFPSQDCHPPVKAGDCNRLGMAQVPLLLTGNVHLCWEGHWSWVWDQWECCDWLVLSAMGLVWEVTAKCKVFVVPGQDDHHRSALGLYFHNAESLSWIPCTLLQVHWLQSFLGNALNPVRWEITTCFTVYYP